MANENDDKKENSDGGAILFAILFLVLTLFSIIVLSPGILLVSVLDQFVRIETIDLWRITILICLSILLLLYLYNNLAKAFYIYLRISLGVSLWMFLMSLLMGFTSFYETIYRMYPFLEKIITDISTANY